MNFDFDIAIIGSGAGGGAAAFALARTGKKVVLLERGAPLNGKFPLDEKQTMVDKIPYDNRPIFYKNKSHIFYNGGIPGGSTALYGAALIRPAKEDFTPGLHYGDRIPKEIWEWPIDYEDLEPYYDLAEKIYSVCGDDPSLMKHIATPRTGYTTTPPDLKMINKRLANSIVDFGFSPFRLPLAINFDKCLHCSNCPGFICPNASRMSSIDACIEPAIEHHRLVFITNADVQQLTTTNDGLVNGIVYIDHTVGLYHRITAKIVIIAAGAIGSAVILKKSDIKLNHDILGKNYMYHAGGLVSGLFMENIETRETFVKQLGFSDLYFGTKEFPHKMGYAQSVPTLGPYTLANKIKLAVPPIISNIALKRMLLFMGTVEDLPRVGNRIEVGRNGEIRLFHQFDAYDRYRSKYYLSHLKKIMKNAGAKLLFGVTSDQNIGHTAHQVGTVRFGNNPKTSVIDKFCRLHYYENVFLVDGSFMPTSLGVSPALTIIANALRVADFIKENY